MYTVTAIAPAGRLHPAQIAQLTQAWRIPDPVWLAAHEAAQWQMPSLPKTWEKDRKTCHENGIDLNYVAGPARIYPLLVADMDSTMIDQECLDELAEAAGRGAEVKAVTARAMNGEIDFASAIRDRVATLEGQSVEIIQKVLREKITIAAGGATLIATMSKHGTYSALVSGGFTDFTEPVAAALGFDTNQANSLERLDARLTGRVLPPILGRDAKVSALQRLATKQGITTDDAIALGDGANDLGMLQIAGLGVAIHAKPAVAAQAKIRIDHCDLSALLYLQGIPKSDFVIRPNPLILSN